MFELLKKHLFLVVIVISIGIFLFVNKDDTDKIASETSENVTEIPLVEPSEKKETASVFVVDVKGEVVRPGVYKVEPEARVDHVIQLAGGFTENADQTMVNLAQKVQDEMLLVIPKAGEAAIDSGSDSIKNDKLRLNYATQEEIETLNGIGPSKAQAIIQFREENGLFQTADELLEISGIGVKTLEKLKEEIQIP